MPEEESPTPVETVPDELEAPDYDEDKYDLDEITFSDEPNYGLEYADMEDDEVFDLDHDVPDDALETEDS